MTKADRMNISSIETFFNSIIDNRVSMNTFFSQLPKAIQEVWTDMVLVDIPNTIQDLNGYGTGTVLVYLYAKPRSNGSKNVPLLDKMEKELNKVIAENNNPYYSISRRGSYTDYDSAKSYHCNIIEIILIIK